MMTQLCVEPYTLCSSLASYCAVYIEMQSGDDSEATTATLLNTGVLDAIPIPTNEDVIKPNVIVNATTIFRLDRLESEIITDARRNAVELQVPPKMNQIIQSSVFV